MHSASDHGSFRRLLSSDVDDDVWLPSSVIKSFKSFLEPFLVWEVQLMMLLRAILACVEAMPGIIPCDSPGYSVARFDRFLSEENSRTKVLKYVMAFSYPSAAQMDLIPRKYFTFANCAKPVIAILNDKGGMPSSGPMSHRDLYCYTPLLHALATKINCFHGPFSVNEVRRIMLLRAILSYIEAQVGFIADVSLASERYDVKDFDLVLSKARHRDKVMEYVKAFTYPHLDVATIPRKYFEFAGCAEPVIAILDPKRGMPVEMIPNSQLYHYDYIMACATELIPSLSLSLSFAWPRLAPPVASPVSVKLDHSDQRSAFVRPLVLPRCSAQPVPVVKASARVVSGPVQMPWASAPVVSGPVQMPRASAPVVSGPVKMPWASAPVGSGPVQMPRASAAVTARPVGLLLGVGSAQFLRYGRPQPRPDASTPLIAPKNQAPVVKGCLSLLWPWVAPAPASELSTANIP